MLKELNKIRNSDFSQGVRAPRSWSWQATGDGASWSVMPPPVNGDLAGVRVASSDASATGRWSQRFRTKKDQHYRIEAIVSCACSPSDGGGLVLSVQPFDANSRPGRRVAMAPVADADRHTLRAYYLPPQGTRTIELRLGLEGASGSAVIHDVRAVPIMEPEAKCHPWAIPGLPYAQPAPMEAKQVCVVTDQPDRLAIELLRARLGPKAVRATSPEAFVPSKVAADAVLLLAPSAACSTLAALERLARDRIVIVSLSTFEAIAGDAVATRLVRQIDDPLHARVRYADFVSQGFALYDILPYASRSDHSTAMRQRQFRNSSAFKAFCVKHELEVLLESETDSEATSEKPIALFKRTTGGALIVMDVEPAEAMGSSRNEPTLAAHMLLSALGVVRSTVGQFTAPARNAVETRRHTRDIVDRFPALSFSGGARPTDAETPCLVTLGRESESVGLPLVPRPALLLRSGLRGDDLFTPHAAMLYFKQLLRPAPFDSPYAHDLAAAFRLAWLPRCTPPAPWGGWRGGDEAEGYAIELEFEPETVAACVDLTLGETDRIRVLTACGDGFDGLLGATLPALAKTFIGGRHMRFEGDSWRRDTLPVEVAALPESSQDAVLRSAAAAGGGLVRIELPALACEASGDSIWRTEWAVQMLEMVLGLMLGVVVVNRDAQAKRWTWPAELADLRDGAVLRRFGAPQEDLPVKITGSGAVSIPPGHALVAER